MKAGVPPVPTRRLEPEPVAVEKPPAKAAEKAGRRKKWLKSAFIVSGVAAAVVIVVVIISSLPHSTPPTPTPIPPTPAAPGPADVIAARFVNLYFCHGCVGGPAIDNELSGFRRKELVARYTDNNANPAQTEGDIQQYTGIDLSRKFTHQSVGLATPGDDEILTIVLIETDAAIKNIDEILSVEGVDVGFLGYDDLSLSMGLGQPPKWDEPRYLEAFDKVIKAANKLGKVAGHTNLSDNPGSVYWALDQGFRMVTVSDVDTFIIQGAQATLEKARDAACKANP